MKIFSVQYTKARLKTFIGRMPCPNIWVFSCFIRKMMKIWRGLTSSFCCYTLIFEDIGSLGTLSLYHHRNQAQVGNFLMVPRQQWHSCCLRPSTPWNLNSYFNLHVRLSFRPPSSVCPPSSVRPKTNFNSCSSTTNCH